MRVLAGALMAAFGVFHGPVVLPFLREPHDPQAPTERLPMRVPVWARWMWLLAAGLAVVGGVMLGWGAEAGLIVGGIGLLDLCCLAVLNGYWMKGRPTLSHHAIRFTVAVAIFVLAMLSI